MLYKRAGFPEEEEIVVCKVTQIFPNSVFVELTEYGRTGLIHISEIAPGRIRNLRDFVSVGREIICKVLRLDREKGHIDLSLRRVNSHERQEKLDEMKQEVKAESLVQNLSKKLKIPVEQLYQALGSKILKKYPYLHTCFKEIVEGRESLQELGVEKKLAEEVSSAVLEKFRPEKIRIQGELSLRTYAPRGVEKIREILRRIQEVSGSISLLYLGGGRYRLVVEDIDYKPAEKTLEMVQAVLQEFNDRVSIAGFQRERE